MDCKCNCKGKSCKKKDEDVIKCEVCNKLIRFYYFDKHCQTKSHLKKVQGNGVQSLFVDEIVLSFK